MGIELTVICEGFNKSRYLPLYNLNRTGKISSLNFINLTLIKYKPYFIPILALKMILVLFNKKYVYISAAPLSPLVIYYLLIKLVKPNKLVYDTSYPYWKKNTYFYNLGILKPVFKRLWFYFLTNLKIKAVNSYAYDYLKNFSKKTRLIPHSVDTSVFFAIKNKFKKDKFVVLFVGKVQYEKGILHIIEAAKIIKDADFWIVGTGNYLEKVQKAGLPNIHIFGQISDEKKLNEIYNKADLFVLPSFKYNGWEELFGIVLIEAMATKTPVIATDCIGPKEIISHMEDGILIKQKSTEELVSAINLLRNNNRLRKKILENAYKKVIKEYNVDIVSNKVESLLKLN